MNDEEYVILQQTTFTNFYGRIYADEILPSKVLRGL